MKERNMNLCNLPLSMTGVQEAVFEVEAFLDVFYLFRRNVLSGKIEVANVITDEDNDSELSADRLEWKIVTEEVMNSIVRHAKKEGIGGDHSPKQNIEEYIKSDAVPVYDPIKDYLDSLPRWDGKNRMAELFGRIPDINSQQLSWCCTWMRSVVAHWLDMDTLHGNECVPVLIGPQGCGKSTFAVRLLPPMLRAYYLDHINFGNKFDSDMALTHNLLVNIDEFANMGASQQGKLKQTLSKVKVNGRPIFGRAQEDRRRYASFIATTNDPQPLCDPTGSRRYLCLRITSGRLIDNETPINYDQLYAQVLHELQVDHIAYWFGNDEVRNIQKANLPYFKSDDMEALLHVCYRLPDEGEDGEWLTCKEVCDALTKVQPSLMVCNGTKARIGRTLKCLGCESKRNTKGMIYRLVKIAA